MKRGVHKPKRVSDEILHDVAMLDGGRCIICRDTLDSGEFWAAHHVLPKSKWPELRNDPANIVTVHVTCHARHESAHRRIAREQLPPRTIAMLERLGEREHAYIERTYPHE